MYAKLAPSPTCQSTKGTTITVIYDCWVSGASPPSCTGGKISCIYSSIIVSKNKYSYAVSILHQPAHTSIFQLGGLAPTYPQSSALI